MYANSFKQVEDPELKDPVTKNCSSNCKGGTKPPSDNKRSTPMKKSGSLKREDTEEEYAEISVKAFFDFMRTAYQVNQSTENLSDTLSASSEINWTELAKNFDIHNDAKGKTEESNTNNNSTASTSAEQPQDQSAPESVPNPNADKLPKTSSSVKNETKSNNKEPLLTKVMKKCLSDVLHEGILDSVLPYMVPKTTVSQPIMKKSIGSVDKRPTPIVNGPETKSSGAKEKDKIKKKLSDAEVEIHVCDEAKNIKRDFRCPQRLLVQKMCYFAEVTAGQKLEEMDISVHCDIGIFDWLMRWVKKDILKKSEHPVLEPGNVIAIMVSASFLQMQPLLEDCLKFCHKNMNDILKTSSVLTCLNDNIMTKLADQFSNLEVENLRDKKDKIQSRLFCKLIMALASPNPDHDRGHFGSLATLFKCGKCGKNVVRSVSELVLCLPSNMRIHSNGDIFSKHARDISWNLNDYIVNLRSELKNWRKVYWRLWGDCHFLFCKQCGTYFPINQMDWCSYHPENPQFFINEQQRTTPYPLGRYPCCSQRAYRFQAIIHHDGCRFREHVPEITTENEEQIINIFLAFRDIISLEPPQLFFPEKITRLVARDPQLPSGKIFCKDSFWWDGIELVPPRQKLGLLGKIWGGSGLPKLLDQSAQKTKKIKRQVSQNTDISSTTSSGTDDDEQSNECGISSPGDETDDSEDSQDHQSESSNKIRAKSKTSCYKRSDGMGSWNSNLSTRQNQDNQRGFEEKAMAQMVSLLTKRALLEYNLNPKTQSFCKNWNSNPHPNGGMYVKLESEFREQIAQTSKTKNPTTKYPNKTKPVK